LRDSGALVLCVSSTRMQEVWFKVKNVFKEEKTTVLRLVWFRVKNIFKPVK